MTLSPMVPRPSASAALRASASMARSTPKLRLAASVPAIDWNTRSTGARFPIIASVLVTCVSTHDWVGISSREMTSSSRYTRSVSVSMLSLAGLTPMTASPAP